MGYRKKLSEMLRSIKELDSPNCEWKTAANKLIEKGVMPMPCKIGDIKYAISPISNNIIKGKVIAIFWQREFLIELFYYDGKEDKYGAYADYSPEELFDTKEEAEKAVNKCQ